MLIFLPSWNVISGTIVSGTNHLYHLKPILNVKVEYGTQIHRNIFNEPQFKPH